jgi:hypothetical protein
MHYLDYFQYVNQTIEIWRPSNCENKVIKL